MPTAVASMFLKEVLFPWNSDSTCGWSYHQGTLLVVRRGDIVAGLTEVSLRLHRSQVKGVLRAFFDQRIFHILITGPKLTF